MAEPGHLRTDNGGEEGIVSYQQKLLELIDSPNASMRKVVACYIQPTTHLTRLMNDASVDVRLQVAIRIDPEYLEPMSKDPYWNVRYEVAKRVDNQILLEMLKNPKNHKHQALMNLILSRLPEKDIPEKWRKRYNEVTVRNIMSV